MTNPQLYPLEINPQTKEPFLRLRKHKNVILTAPRWGDAPSLVSILNDPLVHEWLAGPPYPYTLDHGNQWVGFVRSRVEETWKELENAKDEPTLKIVKRCPVTFLREVQEDGTEVLIGSLDIGPCIHGELMGPESEGVDWENKKKREEENANLEVGDPRKVWCFGDYLAASHHRQGIMTDAVETMLHDWAIPRMNVHYMMVSAIGGNEGSVKVFLRNGFKMKGTYKDHYEVKGKIRDLHVVEWKYSEADL